MTTYVDEVFAAVPQSDWSGEPLTIGDRWQAALASWPEAAPVVADRNYVRPDDVTERITKHNARCAEMWAARQGPDAESWATIAARYGYVRADTAMNAVKRWRRTLAK